MYKIVYNTLENIAKWGVKNIVIISGHADLLHTIAIEQACEVIDERYGTIAIAPMESIFNGEQKGITSSAKYLWLCSI